MRAPTLQKNDQESNGPELLASPTSPPTSPMARPSKSCTTNALNASASAASTALRKAKPTASERRRQFCQPSGLFVCRVVEVRC